MRFVLWGLSILLCAGATARAESESTRLGLDPGKQCRAAIEVAERVHGIPKHLMTAIGLVESGRRRVLLRDPHRIHLIAESSSE